MVQQFRWIVDFDNCILFGGAPVYQSLQISLCFDRKMLVSWRVLELIAEKLQRGGQHKETYSK